MPDQQASQIESLLMGLALALERRDLADASELCSRLNAQAGLTDPATLRRTADAVKQLLRSAGAIHAELKLQLKGALDRRHGVNVYQHTSAASVGSLQPLN